MTPTECAKNWKSICNIYDATRDQTPAATMDAIIQAISKADVYTTFATVAAIKKDDGRIYGKCREVMNRTPVVPECVEISRGNPLYGTGMLDHIHTTHINQLISELIRR